MAWSPAAIQEAAQNLTQVAIAHRRSLHQIPELAFAENETHAYVQDVLGALGFTCRRMAGTGLIADLICDPGAPFLAFRADMDALPVPEETGLPFASRHEGRMHACGHDAHMAMVLAAAEGLRRAPGLSRNVRFLFQPSEEVPPGGAQRMVAEGALDGVAEIYGFHVAPWLPSGLVATRVGAISAAADAFSVTVRGKGGHAAFPHLCRDPIPGAAAMVGALQTLVSRDVGPLEAGVVSVTMLSAGHAFNVIPDEVRLMGTVRAMAHETRETLIAGLERVVAGTAATHGLRAEVDYRRGYGPTMNHKESVARVGRALEGIAGGGVDLDTAPMLGGEDFSRYLEQVPGAFLFLGVRDANRETGAGLHHARFTVDESVLWRGVATYMALALRQA